MDRIGASTSSVDLMGKLSVRVLDSVCHLWIHREWKLMTAPTSLPDHPIPSMFSPDQFPVCPPSSAFYRARQSKLTSRTTNQSILPTYSPPLSGKGSHPHSHFNTGVFTSTPQYVAVVATGRRSGRYREWRGSSLDSVEEVDEKRDELCWACFRRWTLVGRELKRTLLLGVVL